MNDKQKAELLQIFSDLSRQIHQLSALEAHALMEIDTRISRGLVDAEDLERLRQIQKARK